MQPASPPPAPQTCLQLSCNGPTSSEHTPPNMSSLSICAPMRTFRPLSRRLAELSRPCRRNLCDTSSHRPAHVLRLTHDNYHSPQSSTDTARIWQVSKPTHMIQYRAFSGSTSFKTKNILNPRKDDDGKDMLVEISARAANVSYCTLKTLSACMLIAITETSCYCGKGRESKPLPEGDGRIWWLPRLPVSHVAHISGQCLARGGCTVRVRRWQERKGGAG